MLELLFEAICWFIVEVVLQAVAELVVAAPDLSDRARTVMWHALGGATAGVAVALLHPEPLIQTRWMRVVAVLLAPVAAGAVLAAWRHIAEVRLRAPRARLGFWAGVSFSVAYLALRVYLR